MVFLLDHSGVLASSFFWTHIIYVIYIVPTSKQKWGFMYILYQILGILALVKAVAVVPYFLYLIILKLFLNHTTKA